MDENYLSLAIRNLIAKILSEGLQSCYDDVISIFESNFDSPDIQHLIFALEYTQQDSVLLELKIKEYKLHQFNNYLKQPVDNQNVKNDIIYIDAKGPLKQYYEITPDLQKKLRVINFDLPAQGTNKIFKETTALNDVYYIRELTIDSEGKVLKAKNPKKIPFAKNKNIDSIYKGILGDIVENLTNESFLEVNKNDL